MKSASKKPRQVKAAPSQDHDARTHKAAQIVMGDILAVVTAGFHGAQECALAALPPEVTAEQRAVVVDAILLSAMTTMVRLGAVATGADSMAETTAEDEPIRSGLAAAMLTAFGCRDLIEDTFMQRLTTACNPPTLN